MKQTLKFEELEKRYEQFTASVHCQCVFVTELVGGLPADREGLRQFALHHLKITNKQELEKAVDRMLAEEIGEREATPEGGEIQERISYAVNQLRRTAKGPYLGHWMVQACLKQAASRLHIFEQFRGTKGNLAEGGRVEAAGISLLDRDHPELIYLRNPKGNGSAETYFFKFHGSPNSPKGRVSIVHDSECAAPGTQFEFDYRFLLGELQPEDLKDILALAMIVGLGSCKALGRGKFRIEQCEISLPDRAIKRRKEKKEK